MMVEDEDKATHQFLWAGLTLLAYIGNVFGYSLTHGTELTFGLVFIILILHYLSPMQAIISSIISLLYSIFFWNHYDSAALGVLEILALWMGRQFLLKKQPYFIIDLAYWGTIGWVVVLLIYKYGAEMEADQYTLITLKSVVNGALNTLMTGAFIHTIDIYFLKRKIRIRNMIHTIFSLLIFLSLTIMAIRYTESYRTNLEKDMRDVLYQGYAFWNHIIQYNDTPLASPHPNLDQDLQVILYDKENDIYLLGRKEDLRDEGNGSVHLVDPRIYRWVPHHRGAVFKGESVYVFKGEIKHYTLFLQKSDQYIVNYVSSMYIEQMYTIIIVLIISIAVISIFNYLIIKPLELTVTMISDIPKSLINNSNILIWSDSYIYEVNHIVDTARWLYNKLTLFIHEIEEKKEHLLFFRRMIDHSQDLLFVTDFHTAQFVEVNHQACAQLQYSREEILKLTVTDISLNTRSIETWKSFVGDHMGKKNLTVTDIYIGRDGSQIPVDVSVSFYQESEKNYVIWIARDISERLDKESELREKENMLVAQSRLAAMGDMIGNIAHQWRQPITIISLNVQNLLTAYDVGKFSRDYLEKKVTDITTQVSYMSETIDDFRHFFSPKKEKILFTLDEQIIKTIKLLEASLINYQIRLVVDIPQDSRFLVYGYPNEVCQVILNILKNAKEACLSSEVSDPMIHVSLEKQENQLILRIRDNAGGIDPAHIDQIFDPYFTTKGPQVGTGIGLCMSKTIIEKYMFGAIWVKNVEGGAEFTVVLEENLGEHATTEVMLI